MVCRSALESTGPLRRWLEKESAYLGFAERRAPLIPAEAGRLTHLPAFDLAGCAAQIGHASGASAAASEALPRPRGLDHLGCEFELAIREAHLGSIRSIPPPRSATDTRTHPFIGKGGARKLADEQRVWSGTRAQTTAEWRGRRKSLHKMATEVPANLVDSRIAVEIKAKRERVPGVDQTTIF